ncbi:MAG: SAM-dependent methyltransferase [Ktedonobacteraceae bacterium]
MSTENLCIITAQPEFSQATLAELRQAEKRLTSIEELAPGITLCGVPDVPHFLQVVSNIRPVFVRHIAPAQTIIELRNEEQDLGRIAIAMAELPGLTMLEKGTRFAVQTRLVQTEKSYGERAYSSGQLNKTLAEALAEETGAIEMMKKPQIVVSLLCSMYKGYLGISTVQDNLSSWPGGARHFAQTAEQISRAEFKLLEALEVFGVILPAQGGVLDLGAAPGGWTRLLLDAGLEVVAVDPARLDARLGTRQHLEHYRGYAEDYLEEAVRKHSRFDLVVNDMRMDAREAARLLARAAYCLRTDGFVVSVFKLPHATPAINPLTTLKEALHILHRSYAIVHAHQLFHNRQEVTVVAAQPIQTKK